MKLVATFKIILFYFLFPQLDINKYSLKAIETLNSSHLNLKQKIYNYIQYFETKIITIEIYKAVLKILKIKNQNKF